MDAYTQDDGGAIVLLHGVAMAALEVKRGRGLRLAGQAQWPAVRGGLGLQPSARQLNPKLEFAQRRRQGVHSSCKDA